MDQAIQIMIARVNGDRGHRGAGRAAGQQHHQRLGPRPELAAGWSAWSGRPPSCCSARCCWWRRTRRPRDPGSQRLGERQSPSASATPSAIGLSDRQCVGQRLRPRRRAARRSRAGAAAGASARRARSLPRPAPARRRPGVASRSRQPVARLLVAPPRPAPTSGIHLAAGAAATPRLVSARGQGAVQQAQLRRTRTGSSRSATPAGQYNDPEIQTVSCATESGESVQVRAGQGQGARRA